MWFVYILKCSDNSLYCGITKDLSIRLKEHNGELASPKDTKYTCTRRPVQLLDFVECENRSQAAKLEYQIKKTKKEQKIGLLKGIKYADNS